MAVTALYVHAKKALLQMLFQKHLLVNCWYVDGISVNSKRVKEGSARWPALDATYNFKKGEGANFLVRTVDDFWMRVRNAQAVRNRLIIARRELHRAINDRAAQSKNRRVRIMSLAAGSAQAVIETLADFRERSSIRVTALLIDQDESALAYAQSLAVHHGVADLISMKKGDVLFFERQLGKFKPDIIEMMGLLDYLRDKMAISLLRKIRRCLKDDGFFLTCHIHPNTEAYFLRHVVNWSMLYRTVDQLEDILVDSGFLESRFHSEPHGIHSVAVSRKSITS